MIDMLRKSLMAVVLLLSVSSFAQNRFEGAIRGGASMLMYQSDFGKMQPSYNFGLDLLYTYRSPHVVAVRLGASLDYSQSKFNMSGYQDSVRVIDYATNLGGGSFPGFPSPKRAGGDLVGGSITDVGYTIGQVSEAHNQLYVSVPLQLGFYIGNFAIFLGPKFAFPMVASFRQDLTDVDLNVYYPDFGVTVPGNIEAYDFNRESDSRYTTVTGDIDSKALRRGTLNIFASVDIDYYIPISKKSSLGIGLYCDYGLPLYRNTPTYNDAYYKNSLIWLNDLTDPSTVSATHAITREHVSVLNAFNLKSMTPETPQVALIKKLNYLSCGIRLSYQIGGERKEVYKHQYHDKKICHCVFTN